MISQQAYFTAKVQEKFYLSDVEMDELKRTCDFESNSLNPQNTLISALDAVLKLACRSGYDYQQHLLKKRAIYVIVTHFGVCKDDKTIEMQAEALSRFILDYLITLNSMYKFQPIRKIPDEIWRVNDLDRLTFEKAVDMGICWNGKELPKVEAARILQSIKRKWADLNELIAKISEIKEENVSPELWSEKQRLISAQSLYKFKELNVRASVSPRLYDSDPSRIYQELDQLRTYYEELDRLYKKMSAINKVAVEALIEDFSCVK